MMAKRAKNYNDPSLEVRKSFNFETNTDFIEIIKPAIEKSRALRVYKTFGTPKEAIEFAESLDGDSSLDSVTLSRELRKTAFGLNRVQMAEKASIKGEGIPKVAARLGNLKL